MAELPIVYANASGWAITDVVAECRRVAMAGDLKLIVVDYLQLIAEPKDSRDRWRVVGEWTRALKQLALELKCAVLIASQLNRASLTRARGKPILHDLRESGSIEQDADVVMFLHRDEDFEEIDGAPADDITSLECLVRKNRNGQMGEVAMDFVPKWMKFGDAGAFGRHDVDRDPNAV